MKKSLFFISSAFLISALASITGCKKETESEILPLLAATTATEITVNSAVVNGVILTEGSSAVSSRGFCWSTTPEPTLEDNKKAEGEGIGQFTGRIAGLLPGTEYYVSAWATNSEGTSYSPPQMIRTPETARPAVLETITPEYLLGTGALSGGNITDIGGGEVTERGIVWSTDPSPTVENTREVAPVSLIGSGRFTILLTTLVPGRTYFFRAYAINSAGVSYGPEISFRTPLFLGIRQSEFPGETRSSSVTFSLENKVYMGLGFRQDGFVEWALQDFWEWDQVTDRWSMLARFPGTSYMGVGFAIGEKGYVFTYGWYDSETGGYQPNELWEYDPENRRWTKKSAFPSGDFRIYPVAFSIGSKGYIGLGQGSTAEGEAEFLTDLWEWDQATDLWTRKADFPGNGRSEAVAFTVANRGYVGTGGASVESLADFWEYDQQSDRWTRKADFPGIPRRQAVGFAIGNKGYLGAGYYNSALGDKDFWEYDLALDKWDLVGTVASPSYAWIGGSINGNGYLLANSASESQTVELWTFLLTSEK